MTYTFEYIFLPTIVENTDLGECFEDNVMVLDNFETVYLSFTQLYPQSGDEFDWTQLRIRKEMTQELEYWLLTFPTPDREPLAKWGVVVQPDGGTPHYFTFEKASHGKYVFGGFDGKMHLNFGLYNEEDITEEMFVQMAIEKTPLEEAPTFDLTE